MTQATGKPVRVLFVEDNSDDVELELLALRHGGIAVRHHVVETAADLRAALSTNVWDVIISDFRMPVLSGLLALEHARELAPATPFILVSGTVGEVVAVEAMRAGADDYVLKDNLTRLASAVRREIRGAETRRAGMVSEKALKLFADVGERIGKSLDRRQIVNEVPALVVRDFGELCSIELSERGTFLRAALAHADPEKVEVVRSLDAAYPPSGPTDRTLRERVPVVLESLDAAEPGGMDPAFVAIATRLDLSCAIAVPIVSEEQVVGVINLARRVAYSPLELRIVEELSGRVGVAMQNAALYERARRAVEIRDEFMTVASHELRTPLTALQLQIQGLNELARKKGEEWGDDRLLKRLERSVHSLDRLGQLVEGLLDVSRVSTGRLKLNLEPLDLSALAGDTIERFQPEATRAQCTLTLKSAGRALGAWDRSRIEQVFMNLLSNAIKYGAGQPIDVEVFESGERCVVKVVDHGMGVPQADLERIFGRFERAVSSLNYGGLGLGLFITRRIVEAHGGTVSAQPTPAAGATFVVTLPKQPVVSETSADTPPALDAPDAAVASAAQRPASFSTLRAAAFVREVKDYAIYMIDPEGRVLTWNEGARVIKGYPAEEIVGRNFERFFTEEDRAGGRPGRLLARAAAEGHVEDNAWRVRRDGTRFWAAVVITAVHDDSGRLCGFLKVTRDLTRQRQAEELLRQSEERLRLLVESVKDYAIFMLDAQGLITTWNSGAQRINGYRADEVLGRHFSMFYPAEAVAVGHPRRELEVAAREDRYEEEGWRVRKDGTAFWANVVITAIRDPETNALRGFAKVTRDLTERRRMEDRAFSATEEAGKERLRAEQAHSALMQRDEFISIAAHELRTPIAALVLKLQGVTQALTGQAVQAEGSVVRKTSQRLVGALRQTRRLAHLVERLLDVSQIVRGELVMELNETNLTEVARRAVEDFRESALEMGCDIRLDAPGEVKGMWDEARIEQAIVNLLSNAIKYGSQKPVDVIVQGDDKSVRLSVEDRGIGVPAEAAERIFTRFERAAPIRHYGGLGLGLYVTKNIVEAHGGTISVSSRPGGGSSFAIELPRSPAVAESGAAATRSSDK